MVKTEVWLNYIEKTIWENKIHLKKNTKIKIIRKLGKTQGWTKCTVKTKWENQKVIKKNWKLKKPIKKILSSGKSQDWTIHIENN